MENFRRAIVRVREQGAPLCSLHPHELKETPSRIVSGGEKEGNSELMLPVTEEETELRPRGEELVSASVLP
ncbi:hypothetical protein INR49_020560 [Caranx melampygus]|nr:hypothetical protein INR49_020560 [Caranx melampygus]